METDKGIFYTHNQCDQKSPHKHKHKHTWGVETSRIDNRHFNLVVSNCESVRVNLFNQKKRKGRYISQVQISDKGHCPHINSCVFYLRIHRQQVHRYLSSDYLPNGRTDYNTKSHVEFHQHKHFGTKQS